MTKQAPVKMYDAVTPHNIPESAEMVAGYVDGNYAWPPEAWHRWPHALKVLSMAYSQEWLDVINKANRPWPYRR